MLAIRFVIFSNKVFFFCRKILEDDSKGNIEASIVAHGLHHFTVRSSIKLNIPRSLIVPSCNLKFGETLGHGI